MRPTPRAGVAQLVERQLPKLDVASSTLVARSISHPCSLTSVRSGAGARQARFFSSAAATSAGVAACGRTLRRRETSKTAGSELRQTAEGTQTYGSNVTVIPGAVYDRIRFVEAPGRCEMPSLPRGALATGR